MSTSSPLPSPALSGFLRGIAPRARVLLQAQAGPGLDATAVLAAFHQQFAEQAPRWPLAEWPERYWARLLALPALAEPPRRAPDHPLYQLAPTRRLALLLRLVAGLEPAGAARLMGLSETAYRAMVTDAEDRLEALGVETRALLRWQSGFQQQIREAAAQAPPVVSDRKARAAVRRFHWGPLQRGLSAVAGALLLALVATWLWPPGGAGSPTPAADAGPAPLPAETPAVDPDALLTDPDLWRLLDADRALWLADVGWWSWLAHQPGAPPPPAAPPPAGSPPPDAWEALDPTVQRVLSPAQTLWPTIPPETRADLLAQARHWQGLDAPGREALRQRWQAERARPAAERAAERARYAAWRALPPAEQAWLRAVAAAWAGTAVEQRASREAAFAALAPPEQAAWRFGPRLGPDMPLLAELVDFVPVGERPDLLRLLQALPDAKRRALAVQLQALPMAARLSWRDRLLAAPPAQRSAVLAELAGTAGGTPTP